MDFPCSQPSRGICIFASVWCWCYFHFSHSNIWVRIYHFGFSLNSLMAYYVEHHFTCIFVICMCSWVTCLVTIFASFLNEVLVLFFSWVWDLYPTYKHFIRYVVLKYFSLITACIFILFTGSFWAKFLILARFNLSFFFFPFWVHAFDVKSKSSLHGLRS